MVAVPKVKSAKSVKPVVPELVGLMLVVQVLLGIFTLVFGAQIILASMHQISSIFLVSSTVYFLYLNTN